MTCWTNYLLADKLNQQLIFFRCIVFLNPCPAIDIRPSLQCWAGIFHFCDPWSSLLHYWVCLSYRRDGLRLMVALRSFFYSFSLCVHRGSVPTISFPVWKTKLHIGLKGLFHSKQSYDSVNKGKEKKIFEGELAECWQNIHKEMERQSEMT